MFLFYKLINGNTNSICFWDSLSTPLEKHLENERQMQIKSAETEDYKKGVFALIDKKEPEFIGK